MRTEPPTVAILLATFNGARYLAAQLDSLQKQTVTNWRLYVSDDGSTDGTLEILKRYEAAWGSDKLQYRSGPQQGFAQNFLSLACDPNIHADYYAFCDQDDVWLPDKLNVAIAHIRQASDQETVYAYGGRTIYTDARLNRIGLSPLFTSPRTFRNALVHSIAGGNTMVFNRATKNLLETIGVVPVKGHDWWLYQLITGAGGVMHYDPNPYVLYRQHRKALMGGSQSVGAVIARFYRLISGQYKDWTDRNIKSLRCAESALLPSNIELLNVFELMRKANLKDRLRLLKDSGFYHQTWRGRVFLVFAATIRKL